MVALASSCRGKVPQGREDVVPEVALFGAQVRFRRVVTKCKHELTLKGRDRGSIAKRVRLIDYAKVDVGIAAISAEMIAKVQREPIWGSISRQLLLLVSARLAGRSLIPCCQAIMSSCVTHEATRPHLSFIPADPCFPAPNEEAIAHNVLLIHGPSTSKADRTRSWKGDAIEPHRGQK